MKNLVQKIGLGTVQWGLSYGVANQSGKTPMQEVGRILDQAAIASVSVLDTASAYGDAESILGLYPLSQFRVVTKTPHFARGRIDASQAAHLRSTLLRSLGNLKVDRVDALLAHNADALLMPGGESLIVEMQELKSEGKVKKIGVSAYDAAQIDAVLDQFIPDLIQIPLSVMDQRLLRSGHVRALRDKGVEIHVRSVFLQGLLLMPLKDVPDYFEPIMHQMESWHTSAREQGFSPLQASLSFVRDLPEVHTLLVGVESLAQFVDILDAAGNDKRFDASGLGCDVPEFMNPALWRVEQ